MILFNFNTAYTALEFLLDQNVGDFKFLDF